MKNATIRAFSLFSALISLTACGGAYTSGSGSTQAETTSLNTTTVNTSSSTTGSSTGVAPITYKVEGVGYNAVSFIVSTGTILKVTFTPNTQDRVVSGTNYTVQYSKLGVYIGAGSLAPTATQMLSNGYYSSTAQTSSVMDLSSGIPSGCTGTPCRVPVTITVQQPNSDSQCMGGNPYACPWAEVQANVPWNGTLSIQTDDTDSL